MEENETAISIVNVRSVEENGETASIPSQAEGKLSSTSPVPLGPYEPNNPVGKDMLRLILFRGKGISVCLVRPFLITYRITIFFCEATSYLV